jgi:transcriptional antiterminator NusG
MARWYIIHAYSGFENKVKEAITAEAERLGLSQLVEAIEVPTETVTEVKRGKKVQLERTSMAGYVLAKLNMTDDVYHLIRNTPKVTGFLGVAGKPQAIRESEALRMLNVKDEAAARPKQDIRIDYDIGDQVKLLDGPFASFTGIVEGLDFEKSRVKVGVSIFGRATPVDIEFDKVQVVK